MKSRSSTLLIVFLVGITLGVVLLAATGYVMARTNERAFCASCHVMLPSAVTQKMSSHANLDCNDCHLPHGSTVTYYFTKAKLGATDFFLNTFADTELPIMTTESMKTIVNDNCIRCHTQTNINTASLAVKDNCWSCHRNVPHNNKKPLSTRLVVYE